MKSFLVTWKALVSAPHRLFFLGGACQGIAAMLWWLLDLSGRFGIFFPFLSWTIPPVWAHVYLMIYGFFPFFIFGFLFTFFPNWLDAENIPSRRYLTVFFLIASGTVLFYTGLIFSRNLLLLSVLLTLSGCGAGAFTLFRILLSARSPEKTHLTLMALFVLSGAAGDLSFLLWLFLNSPFWLNLALVAGIWFFLLPLIVTVAHLVIPFFSNAVLKNYRVVQSLPILRVLLGGIFFRGVLEGTGMRGYFWIPDIVLLFFAVYLSSVWGFWKSVGTKMLFMLHLSFAWFSIALLLDLLQNLIFLWGHETEFMPGFAPLHALTIGFFSSMVIGLSTRVTFGHSGRPVSGGRTIWMLYCVFQIAAVLRVLADFFPSGSFLFIGGYEGSGLLWIGAFIYWVIKYGPLFWQPALTDQSSDIS